MIHKLQDCLSTLPVEKAWLFGSYSRGEEQPDSDIDLLVRFDEEARISLFKVTLAEVLPKADTKRLASGRSIAEFK